MRNRSNQLELMDLGPGFYSPEEYADCLKKLTIINKLLGGDRATLKAFSQLAHAPASILDVGCGGGDFALKLAKKYPQARVMGIDIDQNAITIAQENKNNYGQLNLAFKCCPLASSNQEDQKWDIVTATLVCHHLTNNQLIEFLLDAKKVARQAIIINDLQRSRLAYIFFWLISPLFNNRLIRHDGLLSIKRGFKYHELVNYLTQAGFAPEAYKISWNWAFRWVITITNTIPPN